MRHLLTRLAAAAFIAGSLIGSGPATAAPLPKLNGPVGQTSPVETAHYYGYRYRGFGGFYPYWRPWYYRPYYYGYGYGYRPYYRNYGYWNRPYYRRGW